MLGSGAGEGDKGRREWTTSKGRRVWLLGKWLEVLRKEYWWHPATFFWGPCEPPEGMKRRMMESQSNAVRAKWVQKNNNAAPDCWIFTVNRGKIVHYGETDGQYPALWSANQHSFSSLCLVPTTDQVPVQQQREYQRISKKHWSTN